MELTRSYAADGWSVHACCRQPDRARALAIRWLIAIARKRGENTMVERLASELMDAANGLGAAMKLFGKTGCRTAMRGMKQAA